MYNVIQLVMLYCCCLSISTNYYVKILLEPLTQEQWGRANMAV